MCYAYRASGYLLGVCMTESRKRAVLFSEGLDFPSIAAGETAELAFTKGLHYGNARAGDAVALGAPAFLDVGLMAFAYVDANDDVIVRLHNTTAAAIDPSAGVQAAVAAEGTLTMAVDPTDTNTFTIGSITYTFLDSFVDAVDNVFTGADLAAAKVNLVAAVTATGGTPGTTHFTTQVANPDVDIATFIGDDAVLTALVAGFAGNALATTETFTSGSNVFDALTLGDTTLGADAILAEDSLWSGALIV
jgi:hypothetical protein